MTITLSTPFPWGAGNQIPGTPFRIVVPAEATGGHAVALAVDMPPGVCVDEHTHDDADQICVVLSGRVGTMVGGVESTLEAGAVQLLPRGVPHALRNVGDGPAKLLEIYTPPGMERVFAAAGAEAMGRRSDEAGADEYRAAADA